MFETLKQRRLTVLLLILMVLYYFADAISDLVLTSPDRSSYVDYLPEGIKMTEKEFTTADNYIIRALILSHETKLDETLPPVYLQHGFGAMAVSWLLNRDKSAAAVLCNAGHRVYILNGRGSPLSQGHTKYKIHESEYWDFTFEDLPYDMMALIDYMYETHQKKIVYVGHSQGGLMGLTALSDDRFKKHFAQRILKMYCLTPVVCMAGASALNLKLGKAIYGFAMGLNGKIPYIGKTRLPENAWQAFKEVALNTICGLDYRVCFWGYWASDKSNKFNYMEGFGTWDRYHPTSVPFKGALHFLQIAYRAQTENCVVSRYDYGAAENLVKYGSASAPVYNFTDIAVPTKIYWGTEDRYFNPADTRYMDSLLEGKVPDYSSATREGWGHMSVTYGTHSETIFEEIVEDLKRYL